MVTRSFLKLFESRKSNLDHRLQRDYIFLTGHDLRRDRMQAGRLASIKVVFSERYEKPNYSDSDFDKLYSEIENDVNESLSEEE